jgi:hypothetical protein
VLLFFPEFNIRLYDTNSESDYLFFPPPKFEEKYQEIPRRNKEKSISSDSKT